MWRRLGGGSQTEAGIQIVIVIGAPGDVIMSGEGHRHIERGRWLDLEEKARKIKRDEILQQLRMTLSLMRSRLMTLNDLG